MSGQTAFAALNFALKVNDGSVPVEAHILPQGPFRSKDGRPEEVAAWQLDETIAVRLIEKIRSRKTKTVIDYEHQTMLKEKNGQPAPAAGWFSDMQWRDSGLHAVDIRWTQRAAAMIEAKEYLYTSAVFSYNKKTGEVLDILSFALTNTPALDDLDSIAVLSRLGGLSQGKSLEETNMDEKDQSIAELTARVTVLVDEAKQKDDAVAALTEQVASLKKQLADIDAEKAAVAAEAEEKEKAGLIEAALTCKQILPADREILAEMALSQVRKFIDARKGVEFLTRQTSDDRPEEDIKHGLTDEELDMCNQVGLSKEEYALAKKAIGL